MTAVTADPSKSPSSTTMTREERRVIFASSLGTVFEWYDFYLYGSLSAVIAAQFFSGVNPTAAFIFALLTILYFGMAAQGHGGHDDAGHDDAGHGAHDDHEHEPAAQAA